MNRIFSAKKYFIIGFSEYIRNKHKFLTKLYNPSIRELLLDYIELHEDILSNKHSDKLNNARKECINSMIYYIKNSFMFTNKIYHIEFSALLEKLQNTSQNQLLDYSHIYTISNSLIKKINQENVFEKIINIVKTNNTFSISEQAIHYMVTELIYEGYSLKKLKNWYNRIQKMELNEQHIDSILDEFSQLKKPKYKYQYYVNLANNPYINNDIIFLDFNITMRKQVRSELNFGCDANGKQRISFLQDSPKYSIYKIEIEALDEHKAIEKIVAALTSYFQMIYYVNEHTNVLPDENLFLEKMIHSLPNGKFRRYRYAPEQQDASILFSRIEERERLDVQDFISYRERVFSEKVNFSEVFNIQRALNIIKDQSHQSLQNKVINYWSVLEYILTFKESNDTSIISKIKNTIPKVICLYIMKDKLNVFWQKIYQYKDQKAQIISDILDCRKVDSEYEYDVQLLLNFIFSKEELLISELEFDISLSKSIADIGLLLSDKKKIKDYIENKKDEITYDLVRSYRARNILIHSGRETHVNLNLIALKLYAYNNNLLGLLIYYLHKNPNYKITEILNSIDYTYDNYIQQLDNDELSTKTICKPPYLFL